MFPIHVLVPIGEFVVAVILFEYCSMPTTIGRIPAQYTHTTSS